MSYPTLIKGQKFALQLGDGGDPEMFTTVCGITTRGLQRTRAVNETQNWDCENPDALPLTEREASTSDWSISGSGQAVEAELDRLDAAFNTPASWRIILMGSGSTVIRSWTGTAIMTDYNTGAVNGEKATISLTLSGTGELVIDATP